MKHWWSTWGEFQVTVPEGGLAAENVYKNWFINNKQVSGGKCGWFSGHHPALDIAICGCMRHFFEGLILAVIHGRRMECLGKLAIRPQFERITQTYHLHHLPFNQLAIWLPEEAQFVPLNVDSLPHLHQFRRKLCSDVSEAFLRSTTSKQPGRFTETNAINNKTNSMLLQIGKQEKGWCPKGHVKGM